MNIKDKILLLFKNDNENKGLIDINSEEFKKAVEERANAIVEEQLKELDKEFIKSISEMIKPNDNVKDNDNKTIDQKVKEILKNE